MTSGELEDDDWLGGLRAAGLPVRAHGTPQPRTPFTVTPAAADLILESWAPATRRAYESAWADWTRWCARVRHIEPEVAGPEAVCDYIASYVSRGLSAAYLARNIAALNAVYDALDVASPARHPMVRRANAGARRVRGTRQRQAAPLQFETIRQIVAGMAIVTGKPAHSITVRRDRAVLLLGWAAALRASELVALDVEDLHFHGDPNTGDGGLLVHVKRSKTDQQQEGEWVAVPYSQRYAACPVRTMLHLARQRRHGALFVGIDRNGREHQRLHPSAVTRIVRRHVAAIGLDPTPHTSHSLRAGWITDANQHGLEPSAIMRHARHTDLRMLPRYDRPADLLHTTASTAISQW